MKTASLKFILRLEKMKANGTAPVLLRITANRKASYTSTGIYLDPKDWNADKEQVRRSHPIAPALNARLGEIRMKAMEAALETPKPKLVKAALSGRGGSLTNFFEQFIDDLETRGQYWEWQKYRVTLGKLQACLGREIDFKELDRPAISRLERYLRLECGNRPNTLRKELQRVRRIFRQAIKEGVIKPGDDPFITYDRPKAEKPDRRKLTLEEMQKLEAVDLPEGSARRATRDAFCFAFYAAGMRVSDVCTLRPEHLQEGRLRYTMLKTATPVSIKLPPRALTIAEAYRSRGGEYLFPFLEDDAASDPVKLRRRIASATVRMNRWLKEVCEIAGVSRPETVSFHVARHSYADHARKKGGNLHAISNSLGHSSLQVTQSYLKSFDNDAVDDLTDQLWGE